MADLLGKEIQTREVISSEASGEEEQYAPLPLTNIMVGKKVTFSLYLKTVVKGSTRPKIIQCCAAGDVFKDDWYSKLAKLKIRWLYYPLADVELVFDYLQGNLEAALKDDTQSETEKAKLVCDCTQVWVVNFFTAQQDRTPKQISQAMSLVDELLGSVNKVNPNSMLLLELRKQNFYIYTHSINCCILGLAFVNYLGWPPKKVRAFGLGALIHDIGYSRLLKALVVKPTGPDEHDLIKIQRHPIEGFRMLQSLAHLPWEALQIILRHHENGDGSGYPEGLKLSAIHPWARIMRIIDDYEELTGERPWHPPMPANEAVWNMRQQWDKAKIYDHQYLKAFISFLAGHTPRTA